MTESIMEEFIESEMGKPNCPLYETLAVTNASLTASCEVALS